MKSKVPAASRGAARRDPASCWDSAGLFSQARPSESEIVRAPLGLGTDHWTFSLAGNLHNILVEETRKESGYGF